MIEKKTDATHKWVISDDERRIGVIHANGGEVLIDVDILAPDLSLTKEFHQALGEAIQIAEAQNNE
jgi:hypothetical protein